jgi:hypothetical protein
VSGEAFARTKVATLGTVVAQPDDRPGLACIAASVWGTHKDEEGRGVHVQPSHVTLVWDTEKRLWPS